MRQIVNKISYILCRYLCVFNLILVLAFVFAGPLGLAGWFAASAGFLYLAMLYFKRVIKVTEEQKTLMHDLGDNDYV